MSGIRNLSVAPILAMGGLFALCAGCSPSEAPAPENPAPPGAPAGPVTIVAPGEATGSESSSNDDSPEKLPEVLAVNTAQFGGLLDKTLGKVAVVNIWATWCVPCVQEMPELIKFYQEADRDSIAFLSLSIDRVEEIDGEIPKFQRAHEVPFPVFVMNERNDEGMFKALRAQFRGGIPVTFIYDKTGKMVEMHEGVVTQSKLDGIVTPLLDGTP